MQRTKSTGVRIKPHPTRHVWLPWRAGIDQLESLFTFPPTQRVSEQVLFPAPKCGSRNGSNCSDVEGSYACTCEQGYVGTGGSTYRTCVQNATSPRRFFFSANANKILVCPADAVSDGVVGTPTNITACRCPAGKYADWSNVADDSLSESLECKDCPAGTWSQQGATECKPCWDNSWSLPGAYTPFMCLCNPGYALDYEISDDPEGDAAAAVTTALTCQVDVTTCNATAGACSVSTELKRGEKDCKDYVKCRAKRGTEAAPCTRCPENAISDAGTRSISGCRCKEVRIYIYIHTPIPVTLLGSSRCLCIHTYIHTSGLPHGCRPIYTYIHVSLLGPSRCLYIHTYIHTYV